MSKNRLWIIGAAVAMLVIVGGGWMVGIAPQLAVASSANSDRANVIAANAKNQLLLAKLKRDYQNIDALKNHVSTLRDSVPSNADISAFVTELNTLATSRKVTLKSITVSEAKAYTAATQVPSTAGGKTATSFQTNPLITSKNFAIIPVQISVTGDYATVLDFVNDVQMGQRLFLVSVLTSAGTTDSKGAKATSNSSGGSQKVDASIGGSIYVLLA